LGSVFEPNISLHQTDQQKSPGLLHRGSGFFVFLISSLFSHSLRELLELVLYAPFPPHPFYRFPQTALRVARL